MNKFVYLLFFLFLTQNLHADGFMDQIGIGDIDISDIDMIEKSEEDSVQTRMDDVELQTATQTLATHIKQPIWQSTVYPQGRDILYHIPYKIAAIEYGGLAGNLFFNMTNKMHTSSSSLMGELQGAKLSGLKEVVRLFLENSKNKDIEDKAQYAKDLSSVVPLLGEITLQERKFGALIQGGVIKGRFSVQLHTSLQMAERNFYISKKRQNELRELFAKYDNGAGDFDESELYYIRFGMGDTRLKLGMNTLNMTDFQNDFGFECIVPTSLLSHSPKISTDPSGIVYNISSNEALQASITDVLRGLRDYLIDPRLGNGGHFGLGCYMESKADLFHRLLQLWMRASYVKLLPADEYRLFMYKQTMTAADLEAVADKGVAADIREALSPYIQEYILPTSFKSDIHPGGIFNFVLAACTTIKKMKFAFGYDYYAQQKESIDKIYTDKVSMSALNVKATEAGSVEQHKLFVEGLYSKKYMKYDLGLGLGGDMAIYSHGIGDDWTVYFKVSTSF